MKSAREKPQITHKGKAIRITVDFLKETLKAERAWSNVLQLIKDHRYPPRLLYATELGTIVEEEEFHNTDRLKESVYQISPIENIRNSALDCYRGQNK